MNPGKIFAFQEFRVEPEARTLWRCQDIVPLNRRAFDVLLYLVQNPGKVITREELLKNVWADTFVDENSVAQSISALRRALDQKPGDQGSVVTLPGRGYQFVAPVQIIVPRNVPKNLRIQPTPVPDTAGGNPSGLVFEQQTLRTHVITEEKQPLRHPGFRPRQWAMLFAVLVIAGGFAGVFYAWKHLHRQLAEKSSLAAAVEVAPPVSRRSIAVLGFRNLSGRQEAGWISTALTEMLATELEAGEKLRLVSGEDVVRTKQELPLADADSLSQSTLARLHKNLDSDLIVLGSYTVLGREPGTRIRLDLHLQDARTGETVTDVAIVGSESELFDMVSQAGSRLREKLGVEAVSPVETVTIRNSLPSNAEAARLYAEGLVRLRLFDALKARDLLQQAVAADGNYSLAHEALAGAWSQLGYDKEALKEARQAYKLAANQSREDRLVAEGRFRDINHEYDQAIVIYRTLFTLFPDNLEYGLTLAAVEVRDSKPQDALATVESLRKLSPPASDDPRIDLAEGGAWEAMGDFVHTLQPQARAVEKARAWGARLILASARQNQCWVFGHLEQRQNAVAACREAHDIFAAVGDLNGEAAALRAWADALAATDTPEAIRLYLQAQALCSRVGSQRGEAAVLNNLGLIYEALGQLAKAEQMHRQSAAIFRVLEDKRNAAVVTANVGVDRMQQGDLRGALALYEEARNLDDGADTESITSADYRMALIRQLQGDLAAARQGYEEALAVWRKNGNQYSSAEAMSNLASVLLEMGDLPGSRKCYEQALALRTSAGDELMIAESRLALADLSLEEGRSPVEQEGTARQVLKVFQAQKVRDDEISAWNTLGTALLAEGKEEAAKEAIHTARQLATSSQTPDIRWHTAITAASVETDRITTRRELAAIIQQSRELGYEEIELDARLTLAKIELKDGQAATGRTHLEAVEEDARAKGYKLIAGKAALARG